MNEPLRRYEVDVLYRECERVPTYEHRLIEVVAYSAADAITQVGLGLNKFSSIYGVSPAKVVESRYGWARVQRPPDIGSDVPGGGAV